MFRYAANEFSKLFNSKSTVIETPESSNNRNKLNINKHNQDSNSYIFRTKNVSKTQNFISQNPNNKSSATTDLNNNDILDISLKNKNSIKVNRPTKPTNTATIEPSTSQLSQNKLCSFDEFDWFKDINTPKLE